MVPVWALKNSINPVTKKIKKEKNMFNKTFNSLSTDEADKLFQRTSGPEALAALRNQRSSDAQDLLNLARGSAQGLTAGQGRTFMNQAVSEMQGAQRAGLRALGGAQAASGLRGGAALAQQGAVRSDAVNQLGQFNTNLLGQKIAAQNQGIQTFGNVLTNQENIERDMAADRLNTALTYKGLQTGLLGAKMQANAAAKAGGGKK